MQGVEKVIDAFMQQIQTAATDNKLGDAGLQLLGAILAMLLIYNVLRTILEGASVRKLFAELIYLAMVAAFATVLLKDTMGVKGYMESTAQYVGDTIAAGSATSNFDNAYQSVYVMFSAVEKIVSMKAPESTGKWYDVLMAAQGIMAQFVMEFILKAICILILIVTGVITIAQFAVSQVMIYLAWILAPLFIPFMVWEQASFLFDGWLKFTIKAYFMKIVGLVMATLLANTIKVAAADITNLKDSVNWVESQWILASALLGMILISSLICYLMWQIGSITDGLLSGSVRANYKFNVPTPKGSMNPKSVAAQMFGGGRSGSSSGPSAGAGGSGGGPGSSAGAGRSSSNSRSGAGTVTSTAPSTVTASGSRSGGGRSISHSGHGAGNAGAPPSLGYSSSQAQTP